MLSEEDIDVERQSERKSSPSVVRKGPKAKKRAGLSSCRLVVDSSKAPEEEAVEKPSNKNISEISMLSHNSPIRRWGDI